MPRQPARYVRFYFVVTMLCLIPGCREVRRRHSRTEEWEQGFLEDIAGDIEEKLSPEGFDAAYLKHVPKDLSINLHESSFAVSKLLRIAGGPKARKAEDAARTRLLKRIEGILSSYYVIKDVVFDYSACRDFVWEVYLAGTLRVRHVLTSAEIADAEGSIRQAIENFNDHVYETISSVGNATPETTGRRPKDGIYQYEIAATIHPVFSENEVTGKWALLRRDSSSDRMWELELDFIDSALDVHIDDAKDRIEQLCLDEGNFEFVDIHLNFCDYDEEIYDVQHF